MEPKKIINTSAAPAPIGPYNQAVQAGGMLFISGQIAIDAAETSDIRSRLKDIDRRLADIESYVTTENRSLAREIEQLR